MPRFYIDPDTIKEGAVLLSAEESHHAAKVFRLRVGDTVDLFDGKGHSFQGVISSFEDGRLLAVKVEKTTSVAPLPVEITLAVSVIKPERMDTLLEKSSELGVKAIAPLITERCVIKLSKERWESKVKRWRSIVLESCKQCGQPLLPQVDPIQEFKAFMQKAGAYDQILIPTLTVPGGTLYNSVFGSKPKRLLVLIGPEGDFTPGEVELARSCGAITISLGPLVLRSETAAIYLLSSLNFFYREVAGK